MREQITEKGAELNDLQTQLTRREELLQQALNKFASNLSFHYYTPLYISVNIITIYHNYNAF